MNIEELLKTNTVEIFKAEFAADVSTDSVTINITKKEHEGDYTIVVFPLTKFSKKSPEQTAEALGQKLQEKTGIVKKFNVIKGFLNLSLSDSYWLGRLAEIAGDAAFGTFPAKTGKVVLEYCGPNTNKPLHIGHLRNMLLGFSMSEILKANGYDVTKVNIYNDRGIAICKSMVAYKRYGNGSTPKSTGIKGDHFVGDWYVKFGTALNDQITELAEDYLNILKTTGVLEDSFKKRMSKYPFFINVMHILKALNDRDDDEFNDNPIRVLHIFLANNTLETLRELKLDVKEYDLCKDCINELAKRIGKFFEDSIYKEAIQCLVAWEAGDPSTVALWKKMNQWVYEGFRETFNVLGVDFQKDYYESETYKLGRDLVNEGLSKNIFYRRKDGAVAVDLAPDGLDEKVLLRADGTSIYITQDLATAELRHDEFDMDKMIYVVANEQDYHFKVLKLVLQKLGKNWADGIYHLSYALVESPTGRFKSREGKTADADDLIDEVLRIAEEKTRELGKIDGFTDEQAQQLYKTIGLGALKYFILRVNPYKKIIFNPEESIDFHGHTGPFVQYTHARISAVIRKAEGTSSGEPLNNLGLADVEREIIIQLSEYPNIVKAAAENYDPSEIANYVYNIAKLYNKFYHDLPILTASTPAERDFRVLLSRQTGLILRKGMKLLGIEVPEKM